MTRLTLREAPVFKFPRDFWRLAAWLIVLGLGLTGGGLAQGTALDDYVTAGRDDPNDPYTYSLYRTQNRTAYTAYFLEMISQQWRSAGEVDRPLWTHEVIIVIPRFGLDSTDTAVLLIDGGSNGGTPTTDVADVEVVGAAAVAVGAVIAAVRQVPNQPLYFTDENGRGRKEDEILAYSLDKALNKDAPDPDPEWAVHLAMTKAAVRAMDTVQAFAASKGLPIEDFLVLGGSKRGWTTWLTAAADPLRRVKAIIPASIDMLNLGRQFIHHWESYNFYSSPALDAYVEFDLPCRMQTAKGTELLAVVDPYAYRDRLTMPKLILNSTGDQFFTSDSSRFYYADLPGPKWLRYTPNTDHKQSKDVIINALSWIDDILDNKTSPRIDWAMAENGLLWVWPSAQPRAVKLWQATNLGARDFRLEEIGPVWTGRDLMSWEPVVLSTFPAGNGLQQLAPMPNGSYVGVVSPPPSGWKAFLIEATFPTAGALEPDQVYSTGVQIIPDTLPYAGTACR
jgi:PhoPQ-activated pathogenicity-related protein